MELQQTQAARMCHHELWQAVLGLEKLLDGQNKRGEEALDKTVKLLQRTVTEFPGTPAAIRATTALRAIGFVQIENGQWVQEPIQVQDEIRPRAPFRTPVEDDAIEAR
jgi:hypothetical protein